MPATLSKTLTTARESCPECSGGCGRCVVCGGVGAVMVTAKSAAMPDRMADLGREAKDICRELKRGEKAAFQAEKRDVCQWITRPKASADRPGHWTARVAICGDVYDLMHSYAEAEGGAAFEMFDFKKQFVGGPHHVRVTMGQGDEACDCQWATYKPVEEGHKACRHVRALRALLAWLEAREGAEYAAEEANRRLAELPDECQMAEAA